MLTGGIQSAIGRDSVPANYRLMLSQKTKVLEPFYNVGKVNLITKSKKDEPSFNDVWCVWANLISLIDEINTQRGNKDDNELFIKIMADSRQGKTKFCFCIYNYEPEEPVKNKRSSYTEGGILSKRAKTLE